MDRLLLDEGWLTFRVAGWTRTAGTQPGKGKDAAAVAVLPGKPNGVMADKFGRGYVQAGCGRCYQTQRVRIERRITAFFSASRTWTISPQPAQSVVAVMAVLPNDVHQPGGTLNSDRLGLGFGIHAGIVPRRVGAQTGATPPVVSRR